LRGWIETPTIYSQYEKSGNFPGRRVARIRGSLWSQAKFFLIFPVTGSLILEIVVKGVKP